MMNKLRIFGFLVLGAALLASCMPSPFFQKDEALLKNEWAYNFKPVFTFDITDTTVSYETTFLIRHTEAYQYCNIWLWVHVKSPGDSVGRKVRTNITLADPSGKWLGRGMGEIWEQRMKMNLGDSIKFNKAGTYQITLEQNMRINPLPDIMNVGVRVEKMPVRRR